MKRDKAAGQLSRREQRTNAQRMRKPIARSPIKKRPRSKSEFARIYGSEARVRFVRALPCVYCQMVYGDGAYVAESQNAHTETGGTGYKAHYSTIIPLCASHHRAYDEHRAPLASDFIREKLKAEAARTDELWLAFFGSLEDTETT